MKTNWIVSKRSENGEVVSMKMTPTKFDRMPGDIINIDGKEYTVVTSPVDYASAKQIMIFQCNRFNLKLTFK